MGARNGSSEWGAFYYAKSQLASDHATHHTQPIRWGAAAAWRGRPGGAEGEEREGNGREEGGRHNTYGTTRMAWLVVGILASLFDKHALHVYNMLGFGFVLKLGAWTCL